MAKKKDEPVILITNDDGITAPGIRNLVEAAKGLGKVVVVAPDKPQSGMGHAITIGDPLRMNKVEIFGEIEAWQTSGTPVDCVKLAVDKVLHRKPDICLSGINHGANHSINVIYSGTMSAAMEASIESIPSIGFSLLDYRLEADFTAARFYVHKIVTEILSQKLDKHLLLNVNIPKGAKEKIKGIKLCTQAYAKYKEEFNERTDPQGKKYYWLTGEFLNFDKSKDTDVWALKNNYVSVVPVQFDLTNYALKKKLEKAKFFKMIFKKDNFIWGMILGFIGPVIGILIFKSVKFSSFSYANTFEYMYREQGHNTLSVALSLSLLINAVLFTLYINTHKDKTAKGIFALTCAYGLLVLCLKTFW